MTRANSTLANSKNKHLVEALAKRAWEEIKKKKRIEEEAEIIKQETRRFEKYIDDPVRFGEELLGECYTDDIKKVMRSVRDNPITIARSSNSVGKTHGSARIAAWFYKCFSDAQVYVTSAPPLENLKRLLWGEIMSIVTTHPELFVNDKKRSLYIYRSEMSFITGVAIPTAGTETDREAKFSGKHAPNLLFIVDEGDAVPDEIYRGIESCMSGGHARLLIMFNPKFRAGAVYLKERDRQANVVKLSALDHPNVITGSNIMPGAVTRDSVTRRIHEWTRPLGRDEKVTQECFEVPGFLEGHITTATDGRNYPPIELGMRKITEPAFSYMVLGQYPDQGESHLISSTWVDQAQDRWHEHIAKFGEAVPQDLYPVVGLDVSEMGTDYSVMCFRYGSFVSRFALRRGIDPEMTSNWAVEECRQKKAKILYVDGTGIGAGIAPAIARIVRSTKESMHEDFRAIGVKVATKPSSIIKSEIGEFYQMRDQLWWAAREWLRTDPNAMLPPDPFLAEELKVPTYSITESGKIKVVNKDRMRDLLKRSPDRADALCLTFTPIKKASVVRLAG